MNSIYKYLLIIPLLSNTSCDYRDRDDNAVDQKSEQYLQKSDGQNIFLANEFAKIELVEIEPKETKEYKLREKCLIYLIQGDSIDLVSNKRNESERLLAEQNLVIHRDHDLSALYNPGDNSSLLALIHSSVSPYKPDPPGLSAHAIDNDDSDIIYGSDSMVMLLDSDHFYIKNIYINSDERYTINTNISGILLTKNDNNVNVYANYVDSIENNYIGLWWITPGSFEIQNHENHQVPLTFIGIKPVYRYAKYEP
ncbi:MAG: hypothetical protein U5P41_12855 [Gammaproteobacteria bacterium]|nr:hypothetical protein [Gammaproteobacteria bacterium]